GALDERGRENRLAAALAIERGNGDTPRPLPRDTPVGTMSDHVEDAIVPPRRNPPHVVVDGLQCCVAERTTGLRPAKHGIVHPDEPLGGGEKDHRVVAAPAMRVLVREALPVPETS